MRERKREWFKSKRRRVLSSSVEEKEGCGETETPLALGGEEREMGEAKKKEEFKVHKPSK